MNSREKNFFGLPIFSPFNVFKINELKPAETLIFKQLQSLEKKLKVRPGIFRGLIEIIRERPIVNLWSLEEKNQEAEILSEFKSQSSPIHSMSTTKELLRTRAKVIANKLYQEFCKHFAQERSIKLLDLGCGQGIIGQELLGKEIIDKMALADIIDYRYAEVEQDPDLPFFLIDPERQNRLGLQFKIDGIFLHTVLHHAHHPHDLINQCIDIFNNHPGLIVIVESGIGIHPNMLKEGASQDEKYFSQMTFNQQLAYTLFMDWFFCKVVSNNINVTYTFNKYEGASCWPKFLNEFEELEVIDSDCIGFMADCPTSFHTIHVVKVNES